MKKKLLSTMLTGVLFLGVALFIGSCSDDRDDIVETAWNIEEFAVQASQWTWSAANGRWESVKQLEYIDEFIYENGAVIGYVYLGTQNVNEIQVQLPYVKSYLVENDQGQLVDFTETVGYEFSHLTNRVTFYIEPSDGVRDNEAAVNYNFRIVMIW